MSYHTTEEFDDDKITNEEAEKIYWQIQSLFEEVSQKELELQKFTKEISIKVKEKREILSKTQQECAKSLGGHKFVLFKKATLSWEHDVRICQKCTLKTT